MSYRKIAVVLLAVVILMIAACDDQSPTTSVLQGDNPPVLQLLEPAPGSALTGEATIRYQIKDDRDDSLTVAVMVNGERSEALQIEKQDNTHYNVIWNTLNFEDQVYIFVKM